MPPAKKSGTKRSGGKGSNTTPDMTRLATLGTSKGNLTTVVLPVAGMSTLAALSGKPSIAASHKTRSVSGNPTKVVPPVVSPAPTATRVTPAVPQHPACQLLQRWTSCVDARDAVMESIGCRLRFRCVSQKRCRDEDTNDTTSVPTHSIPCPDRRLLELALSVLDEAQSLNAATTAEHPAKPKLLMSIAALVRLAERIVPFTTRVPSRRLRVAALQPHADRNREWADFLDIDASSPLIGANPAQQLDVTESDETCLRCFSSWDLQQRRLRVLRVALAELHGATRIASASDPTATSSFVDVWGAVTAALFQSQPNRVVCSTMQFGVESGGGAVAALDDVVTPRITLRGKRALADRRTNDMVETVCNLLARCAPTGAALHRDWDWGDDEHHRQATSQPVGPPQLRLLPQGLRLEVGSEWRDALALALTKCEMLGLPPFLRSLRRSTQQSVVVGSALPPFAAVEWGSIMPSAGHLDPTQFDLKKHASHSSIGGLGNQSALMDFDAVNEEIETQVLFDNASLSSGSSGCCSAPPPTLEFYCFAGPVDIMTMLMWFWTTEQRDQCPAPLKPAVAELNGFLGTTTCDRNESTSGRMSAGGVHVRWLSESAGGMGQHHERASVVALLFGKVNVTDQPLARESNSGAQGRSAVYIIAAIEFAHQPPRN